MTNGVIVLILSLIGLDLMNFDTFILICNKYIIVNIFLIRKVDYIRDRRAFDSHAKKIIIFISTEKRQRVALNSNPSTLYRKRRALTLGTL